MRYYLAGQPRGGDAGQNQVHQELGNRGHQHIYQWLGRQPPVSLAESFDEATALTRYHAIAQCDAFVMFWQAGDLEALADLGVKLGAMGSDGVRLRLAGQRIYVINTEPGIAMPQLAWLSLPVVATFLDVGNFYRQLDKDYPEAVISVQSGRL